MPNYFFCHHHLEVLKKISMVCFRIVDQLIRVQCLFASQQSVQATMVITLYAIANSATTLDTTIAGEETILFTLACPKLGTWIQKC